VLITVDVLLPGTATIIGTGAGPRTPLVALVDSGASHTCIASGIAQALNLQPIGMRPMASAHQTAPVNVYQVDLMLLFGSQALALTYFPVLEFAAPSNSPFQVLVGRDIICRGVLVVSFDRHFTFSI
jgi:hypothetical protein